MGANCNISSSSSGGTFRLWLPRWITSLLASSCKKNLSDSTGAHLWTRGWGWGRSTRRAWQFGRDFGFYPSVGEVRTGEAHKTRIEKLTAPEARLKIYLTHLSMSMYVYGTTFTSITRQSSIYDVHSCFLSSLTLSSSSDSCFPFLASLVVDG